MSDLRFVKFVEHNDWEGETWVFWLQQNGNEDDLAKLAELIGDDSEDYELDQNAVLSERDVDVLVKHGNVGASYLDAHTKVTGVLVLPDDLADDLDALYKGGLRDLFAKDGA